MDKHELVIPECVDSARLFLRPYAVSDSTWYAAMSLRNRDHLARYEPDNPAMSIDCVEDAEFVITGFVGAWQARDAFFMGAFERETGAYVAQIYVGVVDWKVPEFEVGYFVDREHEGRGYVTEAVRAVLGWLFTYLKAHRVRLECDDTNVRSLRVAERCGMVLEGHIRENHRHADGSLTGTLLYGLLRTEFEALRGETL